MTKASPPVLGDKYGNWGPEPYVGSIQGGTVWNFDVSRLTLADFRAMRADYHINASLGVLEALICQADWSIYTKGQETDPKLQKISDVLEEGIRRRWASLVGALCQALWAGYAPTVLVYDLNPVTKYYEVVKYKDLVPDNARVNWKITRGADNTLIKNYDGIVYGGKTIPAENTLWYPTRMRNGDFYGSKLLAPAFQPWFFSQLIHLYSNRYFERFGEPTAVGYYPPNETVLGADGVTRVNSREAMAEVIQNLRSRGVVTVPSDRDPETKELEWEIKYLESQMRGADFDRYLDRLDEEKSLALFTPVLMFRTGERGSFNLATLHHDVFQMMLNAQVQDMKAYLDDYLIAPLHDMNFGPNAPRSEIRFRTLGRLTDTGGQSVLQALIQNGGAKVTPSGLKDLGDFLGIDLEYVSGAGTPPGAPAAPGADPNALPTDPTAPPTGSPLQQGGMADRVASILNDRPAGDPRKALVAARTRLEEQITRAFARDGDERDRALAKVRLGYKGAFVADMTASGADPAAATAFFESFEGNVRDAFTSAEAVSDAIQAIGDTYADYGITDR